MGEVVEVEFRPNDATAEFLSKLRKVQQQDTEALHVVRVYELALYGYEHCFGVAKTIDQLEGDLVRLKQQLDRGA